MGFANTLLDDHDHNTFISAEWHSQLKSFELSIYQQRLYHSAGG